MEETCKDKSENEDNPSDLKVSDESKGVITESEINSDKDTVRCGDSKHVVSERPSLNIAQNVEVCSETLSKPDEGKISIEVSEESPVIPKKIACLELVEASQVLNATDEIDITQNVELCIETFPKSAEEKVSSDVSEKCSDVSEKTTCAETAKASQEPNVTDEIDITQNVELCLETFPKSAEEKVTTEVSEESRDVSEKTACPETKEVSQEPNATDEIDIIQNVELCSETLPNSAKEKVTTEVSEESRDVSEKTACPETAEVSQELNTIDEIDVIENVELCSETFPKSAKEKVTTEVSEETRDVSEKTACLETAEVSQESNATDEIDITQNVKLCSETLPKSAKEKVSTEVSEEPSDVSEKTSCPETAEVPRESNATDEPDIIQNVEVCSETHPKSAKDKISTELSEESRDISEKTACTETAEVSQEPNATVEISESLMEVEGKLESDGSNLTNESLLEISDKSMETVEHVKYTDPHEIEIESEEEMEKLKKLGTNISAEDPEKAEELPSLLAKLPKVADTDDLEDSDDGSQKIKLVFDEPENEDNNSETRSFKEDVMVQISGDIIPVGKLDDPQLVGDLGSPSLEEDLDLDAEMSESEILDDIQEVLERSNIILNKDSELEKESTSVESDKMQTDLEVEPGPADRDTSSTHNENNECKMDLKSGDSKDNQSHENGESHKILSDESASKNKTGDLQLTFKGAESILAPEEQKIDSKPEKSKITEEDLTGLNSRLEDPDDLVEVEDALGLLAEAKPREEDEDENVGDDEDYEDDLEDDEGLEDSHHGGGDSSEVESNKHQTEDETDGLQYECGDSQYFTETEQSMDNMGGLDQDSESLDFESSSGMGFIQSVSTVSVPLEEFEATKDEGDTEIKLKKEKTDASRSKKDIIIESTSNHEEGLVPEEEIERIDGRESEKMVEVCGQPAEIPDETDNEIDIGEEMLILEGKVISSAEFFGTRTSELEDIVKEEKVEEDKFKETAEKTNLDYNEVLKTDELLKKKDIVADMTGDHEKETVNKDANIAVLDSDGNEDTEMVPLKEDRGKSKDEAPHETISEKETQLEKESSASQNRDHSTPLVGSTLVIEEMKKTSEKVKEVADSLEKSTAPDDTNKGLISDKATLAEKENKMVSLEEKLETQEKTNDEIEAVTFDKTKLPETPVTKDVSNKLDEVISVDQDKSKKSVLGTTTVDSKDSDGDSKVLTIVDKSADVPLKETIVTSDQISATVCSTSEKRKTKVLGVFNQDNVRVVDIVDLEESSSDSDDIVVVPTTLKQEIIPLGERQREKTSTITATTDTKEQDQSKVAVPAVTEVNKEVKKTDEGEKKIDKEERKKKLEKANKNSGYAISKEAIPMPAPPIAGIPAKEKSVKDEATVPSQAKPVKPAVHVNEGDEVFSLDSDNDFPDFDDDDGIMAPMSKFKDSTRKMTAIDLQKVKAASKCVNYACSSSPATATYHLAPMFVLSHYREARTKRYKQYVCERCLDEVAKKMESLVNDVRQGKSLKLHDDIPDVVLISDSDDDEDLEDALESTGEKLSEHNVVFLEEHLAEMINSTWRKYGLEEQVRQCEEDIKIQLAKLEKECLEVDKMFEDVQRTTDLIRNDLYDSFAGDRHELPELEIMDTDVSKPEQPAEMAKAASVGRKPSRDDDEWTPNKEPGAERRLSDVSTDTETRRSTRKRKSIPNYSLMEEDGLPVEDKAPVSAPVAVQDGRRVLRKSIEAIVEVGSDAVSADAKAGVVTKQTPTNDDNADITVVESARETAPAGLPPPGELVRAELRAGDLVYAVRQSTFGAWLQARVLEVWPKGTELSSGNPCMFTICKVRFEHKLKGTAVKQLTGRQLAYPEPANVRLPIGTRVIAIFKDPGNNYKKESYYSGVVAEMPNPVNSYRYLVFFDDGYAQYVTHAHTLAVCECSARVWEDVHPDSRDFVRKYLAAYPERPMVRLQPGQALKTEWSGKWWVSHVLAVDASLVQVRFDVDGRAEWIYRGSTRLAPLFLELQAAERHRPRGLTRTTKSNMPYVEYTRLDHGDMEVIDMTGGENDKAVVAAKQMEAAQKRQELSAAAQRAVAKKSVSVTPPPPVTTAASYPLPDNVLSRVVYYSPKAAVKPHKMAAHACSPACRRSDVLPLRELRTYNPLVRPLLVGWERMIHRFKGKKVVLYRAPCGRRLRDLPELHRYLRAVQSDMSVDLFDFHPEVHCLAEFVLGKCYVSKKDLSHGMESIPVPCVNYYDASLPEFCAYSTARTPTDGVPLNLDPDFLCGCDCTDDCQDKTKCQCWKLTLAGAKTIGLEGDNLGYHYKRLPEPLPSGIYECNSRCKCAMTCLNRVVQHPLQLKLQVFKTSNRGWGIRTLNDVPRGAFLCVYAGNLLTDATANRDGVTEGDEYLAELDYIEVVERMKEGYESDVPDDDKALDKKPLPMMAPPPEEDEDSEEEVEKKRRKGDEEDVDFRPEYYMISSRTAETGMRLRKRTQKEKSDHDSDSAAETAADKDKEKDEKKDKIRNIDPDDHFITISDDEEVREPSSFAAQTGLEDDEYVPKHRSVRSFFGKDEACYIMDAKVQGNLGRYLNHSCCPNVFVQNVFVDTHDPRFPWVAFFALTHVPAGTELTWNYNYDVGSVPNKVLYCACGAPNCRGRLL